MFFDDIFQLTVKLGSNVLGVQVGEAFYYNLLFIFLISFLSLMAFIIIKKSSSTLEYWKMPNMINLSVVIIVGIVSFFSSYLIVTNITYFSILTGDQNQPQTLGPVFLFMIIYITGGLFIINNKIGGDNESIPSEIKKFIPLSFKFCFALLFITLSQIFFLRFAHKLPFDFSLPYPPSYRDIVGGIGCLLLSILLIAEIIFKKEWLERKTKPFEKFLHENPRWILITISVIYLILGAGSLINKNFWSGLISVIFAAIVFTLSFYIKRILKRNVLKQNPDEKK